ncbi:MAG: polysaccharide biosynthesis/export family protein [Bryobacteraceae bacterium]
MHWSLLLAALLAFPIWGQNRNLPPLYEVGGANLPAQRIGANDLVAVSVYDSPELTRTVRVSADGFVRLPMLKAPIQAGGRMPSELETAIADALIQENILIAPVVTVTMVEYHSRPINVVGSVKRPLTFQAVGGATLLDAITRAEGLAADAGPEILVSRTQAGENGTPATIIQRIPVKGLIDEADPELNVRLYGGEEIRVPEVGKIFVVGNVRRPGAYPVQDSAGTSVLKLLALSEGLLPYTAKQAFIYRKEAVSGSKNEIAIEISRIIDRKSPDVPLQANDILYIPDNKGKRMTISTLEKLAGFGSATASGMIIWRR